jgi:hypothetical protein
MDEKSMKQMAKMVDALQPHCDEKIVAAMTCSHSGSMSSLIFSKLLGGAGAGAKTSRLPNPVFIAVGSDSIYAFDYAPRGFNFKIKKQAGRWSKDQVSVTAKRARGMANFIMETDAGESYTFEIPTMMGGGELVDMFFEALGASTEG